VKKSTKLFSLFTIVWVLHHQLTYLAPPKPYNLAIHKLSNKLHNSETYELQLPKNLLNPQIHIPSVPRSKPPHPPPPSLTRTASIYFNPVNRINHRRFPTNTYLPSVLNRLYDVCFAFNFKCIYTADLFQCLLYLEISLVSNQILSDGSPWGGSQGDHPHWA
jgi:hypothetical protein